MSLCTLSDNRLFWATVSQWPHLEKPQAWAGNTNTLRNKHFANLALYELHVWCKYVTEVKSTFAFVSLDAAAVSSLAYLAMFTTYSLLYHTINKKWPNRKQSVFPFNTLTQHRGVCEFCLDGSNVAECLSAVCVCETIGVWQPYQNPNTARPDGTTAMSTLLLLLPRGTEICVYHVSALLAASLPRRKSNTMRTGQSNLSLVFTANENVWSPLFCSYWHFWSLLLISRFLMLTYHK